MTDAPPRSPLMDVLADPLPTTSDQRLRRIAAILRTGSGRWTQFTWLHQEPVRGKPYNPIETPALAASVDRFDCGTTACIAGWACLLTEPATLEALPEAQIIENWSATGAILLGLQPSPDTPHPTLADRLFRGDLDDDLEPEQVADVLELLAEIPEPDRHWRTFTQLHPQLAEAVYG